MASQNNNKSTGETFQHQCGVMATAVHESESESESEGLDTFKGNIHYIAN